MARLRPLSLRRKETIAAQNVIFITVNQGRIQEFIFGGPNQARSLIESYGRSPNRGREAPEYRGRSPSRGRELSARELRAKPEPRAKPEKKRGGGVWGGGSVSPSPEKF